MMVDEELRIVAASREPGGLRHGVDVQKTDGDRVEFVGRGCCDDLAGRNWIPSEQEMPTVALERDRPLHDGLRGTLAPRDRWDGRDRSKVPEFDTFDSRGELIRDHLTRGRFASSTGSRHEQEHPDGGA